MMANNNEPFQQQPVARSLTISSPRMMSPRSHRTHRSRRSPRQGLAEDHSIEKELEVGQAARAAENLTMPDNSNTFNIDPGASFLAPAGEDTIRDIEAQHAHEREEEALEGRDGNRFVGGFVFDRLKRAVQGASIQWGSGSRRAQGVGDTYTPPYAVNSRTSVAEPSHQPEYSSSSDDTTHYPATTEEGTTAIDHAMPQPQYIEPQPIVIGSPEFVEPLPAEDYRKMKSPSPPPDDLTFASYFSRFKKLIKDVNALPWVASERITVDYYPGQSKRRENSKRGGHNHHRSAISLSWYGENYIPPGTLDKRQVDLTAGESPEVKMNGKGLQSGPGSSGHGYGDQGYYTSENGQIWPAISAVYPSGARETPLNPDIDYLPDHLHTHTPQAQLPSPPIGSPPTFNHDIYYTNQAGQTWPVVAPGHGAQGIPPVSYSPMAGPSR
ncbi:hypothetical protein E1B28_003865 [Marasmius oreades]|uniref:Uncharacterized protein n=1 Tax=Marasmius oreades TaxID=181124 RepID=A0A9P7UXG4_9AGAR|nr:uncharacterized protein E1B28_003865 [Marasmius oreades]KAG7096428.1 hypothetical protein E1B28_003865 [Marasmius oreades]